MVVPSFMTADVLFDFRVQLSIKKRKPHQIPVTTVGASILDHWGF
jgi:hypothetical protein